MNSKTPKFTDLLVNPKPYVYNLPPFKPKRYTQIHFEQEENQNYILQSEKPKIQFLKKTKIDTNAYAPVNYINWENDLNIQNDKEETPFTKDLSLKLFFEDIFAEQWESFIDKSPNPLVLYYQDPNLIFTTEEKKKRKKSRYNISNDKYYMTKKIKKEENLDIYGVQHSVPALKLDFLFYKTHLNKEELRNYHKKEIDIKNLVLNFNKITKENPTFIKKPEELDINDNCEFVLIEFCEEYPMFINKEGMVSLIHNYKREGKSEDESCTLKSIFPMVNLSLSDPSPFPIGDVRPGHNVLSLSNNLYKTPIFKQHIDFFIVSFNKQDLNNCIIKPVKYFFTAGQVFPLQEVFSPHSKALNVYCKNRLKLAAQSFSNRIIRMKDIDDLFPTFSEGSKRKWLKEYAERKKDNTYILSHREDENNISPENVCQYESMLLSERLLKDNIFDNEMCYWNTSRNFLKTNYIEIYGKNDFNGEGFSFLKGIRDNFVELGLRRFIVQEQALKKKIEFSDLKEKEISDYFDSINKTKKEKEINNSDLFEKGIKIIRIINGKREEEIITDEYVIAEYLKERRKIKNDDKKTALKCGRCGEVGHMKTNKICQFYIEGGKMNKKKKEALKKRMKVIINEVVLSVVKFCFNLPHSKVFHRPVDTKSYPDYLNHVQELIDLSTIKTKARLNKYVKYDDFMKDIELMRDNCFSYNKPEHSFSLIAIKMVDYAKEKREEKKEEILEAEKMLMSDELKDI